MRNRKEESKGGKASLIYPFPLSLKGEGDKGRRLFEG
jgi:hypothetical protein